MNSTAGQASSAVLISAIGSLSLDASGVKHGVHEDWRSAE
jgi:hypothetical protein